MQEATLRHLELNDLAPEIYPRGEHQLVVGPRHDRLMPYITIPSELEGLAAAIHDGSTVGELFVRHRDHTELLIKTLWLLFRLGVAESMEKLPDGPTALPVDLPEVDDPADLPRQESPADDLPPDEDSTMREVRLLISRAAWSAAIPKLRGLVRTYPNSVSVLSALAWSVYNMGATPRGDETSAQTEALELLDRALGVDPEHALSNHYLNRITGRSVVEGMN
jgi:hypothetical protein